MLKSEFAVGSTPRNLILNHSKITSETFVYSVIVPDVPKVKFLREIHVPNDFFMDFKATELQNHWIG